MEEIDILREKLKEYEQIINLGIDLFSTESEIEFLEKHKQFFLLLEKHNIRRTEYEENPILFRPFRLDH